MKYMIGLFGMGASLFTLRIEADAIVVRYNGEERIGW